MYFDIETRMGPQHLSPDDEQRGWDMLRNGEGGISALAVYDSETNWCHVYDDKTIQQAAEHLDRADLLVGYCSSIFDLPCVEGIIGRRLRYREHYDLFTAIQHANLNAGVRTHKGDLTLDAVCRRTLGRGKIDKGSNVFDRIKNGEWAALFNYCLDDVYLTRELMEYVWEHGGVVNVDKHFLSIDAPKWAAPRRD